MIDEESCRRATFQDGASVQLADGQRWSLPGLSPDLTDPVVESLRRGVASSEGGPEVLRDELALTILLLSRNYQLSPELYPQLLRFQPGDPAREEFRRTIRRLAAGPGASPRVDLVPNIDRRPAPMKRWGISAASKTLSKVRSRWSAGSH
jgi:hypothetical protein